MLKLIIMFYGYSINVCFLEIIVTLKYIYIILFCTYNTMVPVNAWGRKNSLKVGQNLLLNVTKYTTLLKYTFSPYLLLTKIAIFISSQ